MAIISLGLNTIANASTNESIKGIWEYQVPSAPYEYSKGELVVNENDGQLTLKVKFMNGGELMGEKVKFEDGKLSFGVHLDGDLIEVWCKLNDDQLVGEVSSPDGPTSISAKKKE